MTVRNNNAEEADRKRGRDTSLTNLVARVNIHRRLETLWQGGRCAARDDEARSRVRGDGREMEGAGEKRGGK